MKKFNCYLVVLSIFSMAMLVQAKQPESNTKEASDLQNKTLKKDDPEILSAIKQFAKDMAQEGFKQKAIEQQLLAMEPNHDIIARISKPAESMPWYKYRKIWMKDNRINGGVEFWQKELTTLRKAESAYGVDQSIIVGILGVETFYGKFKGQFPVIEALYTLGFYYPKRADFFRKELGEFYHLSRSQKWDMNEIKGSYAGAMGMGQFISSSYRNYGVDFNQDGKVNLFSDVEDMTGSVANYFQRFKWQNKGFVARQVMLTEQQKSLVQESLELTHTLEEFRRAGVNVEGLENKTQHVGLFAFELADGTYEYWLVGDNFYTITRYNHNAMYALAVFQLSEAIKRNYLQMK